MTPEDWQRAKPILAAALELDSAKRASFLKEACADASLRDEIQSLIVAHEQVGAGALNSAAPPDFSKSALSAHLELTNGTRLGDFQILSLLGAGGMGEVYRARDLRLERDVAIKVLPRFVSLDPERLRRFEQEAKAAAGLNHPNILAVFQMGTHEGAPYLVSELLEGATLREQVKRGPIPPKKAIDYGAQIAHGLAAAHEKGIVHRDLKPENLFVTRDGRVKILDFGLAKLLHSESETQLTQQTLDTKPGAVMGTVGYMAPEQVRGLAADHRADIFALGAILYEMLTGRRAFRKPTSVEMMSAVLSEDPPLISQITANVPPALERAVHRCLEKNLEQRFQSASDLAFALELSTDSGSPSKSATASAKSRTPWKWLSAAGMALLLASGALLWRNSRASARLSEKDTVVLSDFANATGDPIFDGTMKQGLSGALRQSPFLNVLSDNGAATTLHLMMRPPSTPLTPEVTREICQRADGKAWIEGSIASIGSEYVIGLKAVNCQSGDILAQEQVTAANKEKVLDAMGGAASKLRVELGETLANVKKFDVPLSRATTASLEALKAESLGYKTLHEKGTEAALPFFEHAVELDPNFASGYLYLGKMYINTRQLERAKESLARAYALRQNASEREKFDIESTYYEDASGELESATRVFREWLGSFPRDDVALGNLGNTYFYKGQYEQAVELYRQSSQVNPFFVIGYSNLALGLMSMNRFAESRKTIQEAFDRKLDDGSLHYTLYDLAFVTGDGAGMAEQVAWSEGKPESIPDFLLRESNVAAYSGHLRKARELQLRAVEEAEHIGNAESASSWRMAGALREAAVGNFQEAQQSALVILKRALGQDTEEMGALALAWAGAVPRAESILDDLNRRFPQNTLVQSVVLTTVRARIELSRGNPTRSIDLLQTARPYELTATSLNGCIYPGFVRGLAYLSAGQGANAAAEFQRILDHRGVVVACVTGALAHLGLARAYTLQGDTSRARAAYQDFLSLWKDADPDVPILKEAKAEFAKLP